MLLLGCIWRSVEKITHFDVRMDRVDSEREVIWTRFQMLLDCIWGPSDGLVEVRLVSPGWSRMLAVSKPGRLPGGVVGAGQR